MNKVWILLYKKFRNYGKKQDVLSQKCAFRQKCHEKDIDTVLKEFIG